MTPAVVRTFGVMYDHAILSLYKSPNQISGHRVKLGSCVMEEAHF